MLEMFLMPPSPAAQIADQEFSDFDNRSRSELMRAMDSLRLLQGQTHQTIANIVLNFLRTPVSALSVPCTQAFPIGELKTALISSFFCDTEYLWCRF